MACYICHWFLQVGQNGGGDDSDGEQINIPTVGDGETDQ